MSEIILSRKLFNKDGLEVKSAMYIPTVTSFKSQDKDRYYLTVSPNMIFSFSYKAASSEGSDYWAEKRFNVTNKNIHKVKRFFREIYSKFKDEKYSLFITDETGKHVNQEYEMFRPIRTTVFETSHYGKCMIADPGCKEIDGTVYEGIYLFINYTKYVTFIPWPDLEELICIVEEMDCNNEAIMLMTSLQLAERYKTIISQKDLELKLKNVQK